MASDVLVPVLLLEKAQEGFGVVLFGAWKFRLKLSDVNNYFLEIRRHTTVDRRLIDSLGLLNVGAEAVRGGASLLERWLKGGVETAAQDLAYAPNWNGQAVTTETSSGSAAAVDNQDNSRPAVAPPLLESTTQAAIGRLKVPDDYDSDEDEGEALPGMPSCPITGEPMVNPVVAADGHTYERSAIARWFLESDKSPLTGAYVAHKELVPNYVLLSSLEQSVRKSDDSGDE